MGGGGGGSRVFDPGLKLEGGGGGIQILAAVQESRLRPCYKC